MRVFFLLVLCLAVCTLLRVEAKEMHHYGRQREIFLHNRIIDTREADEFHADKNFAAHKEEIGADDGHQHLYLVHFRTPYEAKHQRMVKEDVGVSFVGYMPHNTFLFEGTEAEARKVQAHSQVKWVGPFLPDDRIPDDLVFADDEDTANHSGRSLKVVLTPAGAQRQDDVAEQWKRQLPQQFDESIELVQFDGVLQVQFDPETVDMKKLAVNLSKREFVHWIEPHYSYVPHNAWARGVVQGGAPGVTGEAIFAQGLRGEGEVIALGDTGLDMSSCYLSPSSGSVPYDTLNMGARKVVSYVTEYGDDQELPTPHGTPVAAALVGEGGDGSHNGGAPRAKLFFMDLNDGTSSEYFVPANPDQSLFALAAGVDVGARVQVYPWGRKQTAYSELDVAVDSYSFSGERRFVGVFSVGNEGRGGIVKNIGTSGPGGLNAADSGTWAAFVTNEVGRAKPKISPINSPASAKNSVGVGATYNDAQAYLKEPEFTAEMESVATDFYNLACGGTDNTVYNRYEFCASLGFTSASQFPCNGARSDFCGRFDGSAGQCCNFDYLDSLCCPETVRANAQRFPVAFGMNSLASFSSNGPTADGRIKPDVVAPGHLIHSATTGACETDAFSGSSFAAAHVGAAAALVREYFVKGNYEDIEIDPTGALVKAMLVNSGQPITMVNVNDRGNFETLREDLPNMRSGFGRVQLDRVLRTSSSDFNLFVDDEVSFETYENATANIEPRLISQRYCMQIPEDARYVKATMVYFDESTTLGAGVALVNNLDMVIQNDEGFEYRANNREELDHRNTVEQIYLERPAAGIYHLLVHPTLLVTDGSITFSLVITGDFALDPLDCQPDFQCPFACSNRGTCHEGRCICAPPFNGPDCSLTPCGFGCSGNGYCYGENGQCVCDKFWEGANCATFNELGVGEESIEYVVLSDNDLAPGIVAGIAVACFIIGFCAGGLLAGYLTYRYLLRRQRQRMEQFKNQLQKQRNQDVMDIMNDSDEE